MKVDQLDMEIRDSERFRIDETGRSIGVFSRELPRYVDWDLVGELKEMATHYGDKNVRLCLHANSESLFHTMVILERSGKYYRPHKHLDKGECFHIIEGKMLILSFSDEGSVIDRCLLEPERAFMYRVAENMYHVAIPLTNIVIYHESKLGPFLKENDSVFPLWAPDGSNEDENAEYCKKLVQEMN